MERAVTAASPANSIEVEARPWRGARKVDPNRSLSFRRELVLDYLCQRQGRDDDQDHGNSEHHGRIPPLGLFGRLGIRFAGFAHFSGLPLGPASNAGLGLSPAYARSVAEVLSESGRAFASAYHRNDQAPQQDGRNRGNQDTLEGRAARNADRRTSLFKGGTHQRHGLVGQQHSKTPFCPASAVLDAPGSYDQIDFDQALHANAQRSAQSR